MPLRQPGHPGPLLRAVQRVEHLNPLQLEFDDAVDRRPDVGENVTVLRRDVGSDRHELVG